MTNERNALKAGIFIVLSIALIIALIIAIKGVGRFIEPMQHRAASFTLADDIGGLSPGDEVRVGGAKVGVVRHIEFTQRDGSPHIVVHFTIPRRFDLRTDAVVGIQSTVTGVSVLNFSSLGTGQPLAEGELLAGRPAPLNQLMASADDVRAIVRDVRDLTIPKVHNAIDKTTETVTTFRTTGQTATDSIAHLRSRIDPVVERYYAVADKAREALTNISEMFGETKTDFRTAVANVKDATGTAKEKLPGMMQKMDGLLTDVKPALEDARKALEDIKAISADTRETSAAVRQIIVGKRGKIETMIDSMRDTAVEAKMAVSELRRSPWRLFYRPGPGERANQNLFDAAREFAEGARQLNDAALALRDALKARDADPAQIQKLLERVEREFGEFNKVERTLWQQVQP